jgi:hypothetical protein
MSDNRPPKAPTSQLIFPNAEATNANQIQNLLNIGAFAMHALVQPGLDEQPNIPGTRPELPKEARIAAENTFVKVLEIFDGMLADSCRWSLDTQKKMAARFDEAHALNLKYLESQAEFAHTMNLPHFRFKPTLMRLKDGRMLAMIGSVDDLDNAIVGIGASAAEALQRFDETFDNGVPANMAEWLARREKALEEEKTPEPYPIKNEQTQQVDTSRSDAVKDAPKRRKNKSGNR